MRQVTVSRTPKGAPDRQPHTPPEVLTDPEAAWDDEDRYEMIAENAYFRAERRGFQPGFELDDWLAAEQEVDARLGRRD